MQSKATCAAPNSIKLTFVTSNTEPLFISPFTRSASPNETYTLVNPLQPENAEDPMLVTLSGIVTLASPLQPENA